MRYFEVVREGAFRPCAAVRRDAADAPRARLQHDVHRCRQRPHPGRAIVISALDNLVKGASGQAIQNMNLVMGYPETMGWNRWRCFRDSPLQWCHLCREAYAHVRGHKPAAAARAV